MAHDPKCYALAEAFLEDEPHINTDKRRDKHAQAIQDAIDLFIVYELDNYEPPDPPGFEAGFADNH